MDSGILQQSSATIGTKERVAVIVYLGSNTSSRDYPHGMALALKEGEKTYL